MIPEIRKDKEGNITIETVLNREIMNRKWSKKIWEAAKKYQDYSIEMIVRDERYNLADRRDIFFVYTSEANRGLIVVSKGEDASTAALMMYYLFNPVGGDENANS